MNFVTAESFGDLVPEPRSPLPHLQVDVRDKPSSRSKRPLVQHSPTYGQEPDIGKWPAWKVSLFVIGFCGAFWAGVIYLCLDLFG